MASVFFFLRFVAILLLVVSIVYCDVVGHGRHELVNGKIVKLRGNTKIAEKPEDLELYRSKEGSCDVEMDEDKDGNITIWYLKHSKTTKEGCSIDFAVPDPTILENKYNLHMFFGIQHNKELSNCLMDITFSDKVLPFNYSAIASNLLSFSFSLTKGEFDGVKRGYPERHKNYCGDLSKCHNKGGKCLDVADYTVGWARTLKYIRSIIHPIGETDYSSILQITEHNKHQTDIHYYFDGMGFRSREESSPKAYFCFKQENVRKPEKWKITDEDYTDTLYNHLFTFHILPTSSMQMSMQNIWIKCDKDADKENCNENAAFQQCDKMFVNFPRVLYKMLVPDNSVKQTTTEETTTMATCPPVVECPDVVSCQTVASCPTIPECQPCGIECPEIDCPEVDCPSVATNILQHGNSTEKVKIKPQNGSSLPSPTNDCYNEGTKKDSKKTLQITLVIVGSIILLLMFTALLICLFVSKSK